MLDLIINLLLMFNCDVYGLMMLEKTATLSTDYKGTPFGSLVPYALDGNGNPIVFLSSLATHTKNLDKRPECSIMVVKVDHSDVFNSARVTLLGKMEMVNDDKIRDIFFGKFPKAKEYGEVLGDFSFYIMKIDKVYYIGGFGDINWIKVDDYAKKFKRH